jgi:hypothetical protein
MKRSFELSLFGTIAMCGSMGHVRHRIIFAKDRISISIKDSDGADHVKIGSHTIARTDVLGSSQRVKKTHLFVHGPNLVELYQVFRTISVACTHTCVCNVRTNSLFSLDRKRRKWDLDDKGHQVETSGDPTSLAVSGAATEVTREEERSVAVEEATQLARKKAAEINALLTAKTSPVSSSDHLLDPRSSSFSTESERIPHRHVIDLKEPVAPLPKKDYFADPAPSPSVRFQPPLPKEQPPLPSSGLSISEYDKHLSAKVSTLMLVPCPT